MVLEYIQRHTLEEFEAFIRQPENADRRFEFIVGEIVEVVSNNFASEIAASLLAEIHVFTKRKKLGRVTGADGGYIVMGERYIPDVAFISIEKQPEPCHEAYNPNAPDLVIEVISPTDTRQKLLRKLANYHAAGIHVWVVWPENHEIEVHEPGQKVKIYTLNDTLDGGSILPGFTLAVKDIFPDTAES